MKPQTIEIIYLATGSYKQYIPTFFDSLDLFFPGHKKIVTVISDDLNCCKNINTHKDIDELNIRKIIHLPYPFVSYFKYHYIKEFCSKKADYVFYFDADTAFIQNDKIDFNKILDLADNHVLMSLHPFYAYPEDEINLQGLINCNTERNPMYSTYIDNEYYYYVIGSFFAGTTENVLILCDDIINMMATDLKNPNREWYVPKYMDEAYLNSVSLHTNNFSCVKEQFIVIQNNHNFTEFTFCKQKWNPNEKEERVIE